MLPKTFEKRILRSALASKLAYDYKPHTSPERQHPKNIKSIIRLQTPHLVAINTSKNNVIVAFKGSTTIDDVHSFMKMAPKEFRYRDATVHVHKGVLDMFQFVQEQLDMVLTTLPTTNSNRPIVTFTGHSQGGSLALFASAYYGSMFHGNLDVICHTFGAPRVGNLAFHEWHASQTLESINITHSCDVVPFIPMGFGYLPNPNLKTCRNVTATCADIWTQHNMDTYLGSVHFD
jgi:predicted lipase